MVGVRSNMQPCRLLRYCRTCRQTVVLTEGGTGSRAELDVDSSLQERMQRGDDAVPIIPIEL